MWIIVRLRFGLLWKLFSTYSLMLRSWSRFLFYFCITSLLTSNVQNRVALFFCLIVHLFQSRFACVFNFHFRWLVWLTLLPHSALCTIDKSRLMYPKKNICLFIFCILNTFFKGYLNPFFLLNKRNITQVIFEFGFMVLGWSFILSRSQFNPYF